MPKTKYAALAVCLFIISFWIGYFCAEYNAVHVVSATVHEYKENNLTLIDENGDLWAFCEVAEPAKDCKFEITYKGWFRLLKLTCNGQEISFV